MPFLEGNKLAWKEHLGAQLETISPHPLRTQRASLEGAFLMALLACERLVAGKSLRQSVVD